MIQAPASGRSPAPNQGSTGSVHLLNAGGSAAPCSGLGLALPLPGPGPSPSPCPGPGSSPGHSGAAGVLAARALAVGGGPAELEGLPGVQPQVPVPLPVPAPVPVRAVPGKVQIGAVNMGFPSLHSAIPHSQHPLARSSAASSNNLFDHNPSSPNLHRSHNPSAHQLRFRAIPRCHRYRHRLRHCPPLPGTKMEPDRSLQDDLAAQEAAARTWQPELEV